MASDCRASQPDCLPIAHTTPQARLIMRYPWSLEVEQVPTRLRVIELTMTFLSAQSTGAGPWRIFRSKGGRGWKLTRPVGPLLRL